MTFGRQATKLNYSEQVMAQRACKGVTQRCMGVAQVWENCRLYNPVGTQVRGMGDRLSETWEKKWYQSGIEARWEGLMRELKEEEVSAALRPACTPPPALPVLGTALETSLPADPMLQTCLT